jgi:hypothetical protein
MSLPAISKHLKVLERAGLITRGRDAQWRPCQLNAEPLKDVEDWLEQYRQFWEESSIGWMITCTSYKPRRNKMGNKNDSTDTQSDREIVITRVFNAPRELVFKAGQSQNTLSSGGVRKASQPVLNRWISDPAAPGAM